MSGGPAPKVVADRRRPRHGGHAAGGRPATPTQVTADRVGGRRRRLERPAARAARRGGARATCASAWSPWPTPPSLLGRRVRAPVRGGRAGRARARATWCWPAWCGATGDLVLGGRRGRPAARGGRPGPAGHHRAGRLKADAGGGEVEGQVAVSRAGPDPVGLAGARRRRPAPSARRGDRRGRPGGHRAGVALHERAGRRGRARAGPGHRRDRGPAGLRLQPAPADPRDPGLRRGPARLGARAPTGSRSTLVLCDTSAGMALGTVSLPVTDAAAHRSRRAGPRSWQTGGGAGRSARMSARASRDATVAMGCRRR